MSQETYRSTCDAHTMEPHENDMTKCQTCEPITPPTRLDRFDAMQLLCELDAAGVPITTVELRQPGDRSEGEQAGGSAVTWIVGHVERQRAGDASPMPLTVSEMSAPIPTVMPMESKTATLAQDGA